MTTEALVLMGACITTALAVEGAILLWAYAKTLEFLRENMQVGGTPLAVVKAQVESDVSIKQANIARLEETRKYQRASISD
jgi:hypothetical protein